MPPEYFEFLNAWESVPKGQRNLQTLSERLCIVENRLTEKNKSFCDSTTALMIKTKGRTNENNNANQSYVRPNKHKPKCFNCGLVGHIKAHCRKPLVTANAGNSLFNTKNGQPQFTKNNRPKNDGPRKSEALLTLLSANCEKSEWFVDSGATAHMSPNKMLFEQIQDNKDFTVTIANNEKIHSEGIGNIKIKTELGEKEIKDAIYVPEIKANLLSVSKMTEKGHVVIFDDKKCTVYNEDRDVIVTATKRNDLYVLNELSSEQSFLSTNKSESSDVWHKRLGHLNRIGMDLLQKGMADGILYHHGTNEQCV